MELYEKIRNIRERQEIKQKEMAKYLHMQPTTYNAYENGKRAITADILKNICLILKVSSDELLEINIKKPYNDLNDENSLILEKIKRGFSTERFAISIALVTIFPQSLEETLAQLPPSCLTWS